MKKLKTAIILDNMLLSKWQLAALKEAASFIDIKVVLNCQNTKSKKRIIKNFFYYLLNLFTLKNDLTKKVAFDLSGRPEVLSFDSNYQGLWQSIPSDVLLKQSMQDIDVIIKFGMGLLKIDGELAKVPVLSYHHGDPSKYRGRPAGFYEILNGENKCGVIVQNLTNKLDAGEIYAFAEAKVVPFSYKKTALNFYSISHYLLKKAILNLTQNKPVKISKEGKNYTLPSNFKVVLFLAKVFANSLAKLLYGLFYEKRWQVALSDQAINFDGDNKLKENSFRVFPIEPKYNFYADPFFSRDYKKVCLEALNNDSGLGDIVEFDVLSPDKLRILFTGNHYSYPYLFEKDGDEFILPEVASHSNQFFCKFLSDENGAVFLSERFYLKGLENKRIVDGTLLQYKNHWYFFFGESSNAHTVLHLWCANTLESEFAPHPNSPVCLSPSSARMGGRICFIENTIYRFGQDNSKGYGESITISKISLLTPENYEEQVCGRVSIENKKGPHTIDVDPIHKRILVDYYEEVFSIYAGVRRLKARAPRKTYLAAPE